MNVIFCATGISLVQPATLGIYFSGSWEVHPCVLTEPLKNTHEELLLTREVALFSFILD